MFRLLVLIISTSKIIQRCCNFGKAFYEAPKITNKANKRFHFSVSVWRWTLSNGFKVLLRWKNPFLAHMVSQIIDLRLKHITLRWLQFEAVFSKVIKDHPHSLEMLLRHLRENYHIIQVDEAIGEVQLTQTVLHEPLESKQGIKQPERHSFTLIQTHTVQCEGSILLRFLVHGNLPRPRIEIESGIMGSSS